MTKHTLITADQTPDCPPHWYYIDSNMLGTCKKCEATKDFAPKRISFGKDATHLEKARQGGIKSGTRRRLKGKGAKR